MHGKVTMSMSNLRSEHNTTTVERKIRSTVRALGYHGDVVYEHGHWWLVLRDGSVFDVVDTDGGNSVNGFALERVS